MLYNRYGTVAAIGSLPTMLTTYFFFPFDALAIALMVLGLLLFCGFILCLLARSDIRNYPILHDTDLIPLPITQREVRLNKIKALTNKATNLEAKAASCHSLMREMDDGSIDSVAAMQVAVLVGERDASKREAKRLREDAERLKVLYLEDERGRKYRELTKN